LEATPVAWVEAHEAAERVQAQWLTIEDAVRREDRTAYGTLEQALGDLRWATSPEGQDPDLARSALVACRGGGSAKTAPPATFADLPAWHAGIRSLRHGLVAGPDGTPTIAALRAAWPDVEGSVSLRDPAAYTAIEAALARIAHPRSAAAQEADLASIDAALETLQSTTGATWVEVLLILVREGIEALVVVGALLAWLARSGSAAKTLQQPVIFGAVGGLAVSIGLAWLAHRFLNGIITGARRELVEGLIGLVAAVVLLWVAWWLHQAHRQQAWAAWLKGRVHDLSQRRAAVALGGLAFLAVVREGAETVLFLIALAPTLPAGDLSWGLLTGAATLVVIGAATLGMGLRLPLAWLMPLLTFLLLALAIKFIGAGIHALQISGLVSATPIGMWPAWPLLGWHPTWETALAQGALLVVILLLARPARRPTPAQEVAT